MQRWISGLLMASEQGHQGQDQSRQKVTGHSEVGAPGRRSISGEAHLIEDRAEDLKSE